MSRLLPIIGAVTLFAICATAQPVCTVDPNTGWLSNSTKSGVCFYAKGEATWWYWVIGGADGQMWAWWPDEGGDKTFARLNKDGDVWLHLKDHVANLMYCPVSVVEANLCYLPEFGGSGWIGSGQFSSNQVTSNPIGADLCPASEHYTGEVTSPKGEVFKVDAVLLTTKDKDDPSGCRVVVNQITLKAK